MPAPPAGAPSSPTKLAQPAQLLHVPLAEQNAQAAEHDPLLAARYGGDLPPQLLPAVVPELMARRAEALGATAGAGPAAGASAQLAAGVKSVRWVGNPSFGAQGGQQQGHAAVAHAVNPRGRGNTYYRERVGTVAPMEAQQFVYEPPLPPPPPPPEPEPTPLKAAGGAMGDLIDHNTRLLQVLMGDDADAALAELDDHPGDPHVEPIVPVGGMGAEAGAFVGGGYTLAPAAAAPPAAQQYVDVTAMMASIRDLESSNARNRAALREALRDADVAKAEAEAARAEAKRSAAAASTAEEEVAEVRSARFAALDEAKRRAAEQFKAKVEELAAAQRSLADSRRATVEASSKHAAAEEDAKQREAVLRADIAKLEAALAEERAAKATAEEVARDALLKLDSERRVSRELYQTVVQQAAAAQTQKAELARAEAQNSATRIMYGRMGLLSRRLSRADAARVQAHRYAMALEKRIEELREKSRAQSDGSDGSGAREADADAAAGSEGGVKVLPGATRASKAAPTVDVMQWAECAAFGVPSGRAAPRAPPILPIAAPSPAPKAAAGRTPARTPGMQGPPPLHAGATPTVPEPEPVAASIARPPAPASAAKPPPSVSAPPALPQSAPRPVQPAEAAEPLSPPLSPQATSSPWSTADSLRPAPSTPPSSAARLDMYTVAAEPTPAREAWEYSAAAELPEAFDPRARSPLRSISPSRARRRRERAALKQEAGVGAAPAADRAASSSVAQLRAVETRLAEIRAHRAAVMRDYNMDDTETVAAEEREERRLMRRRDAIMAAAG